MIDQYLLDRIVCPVDRQPLILAEEGLRCSSCNRLYPIEDGIPILLPERAVLS